MKSTSRYAAGLLLILGATLAGEVVRLHLSPPNMVMLYLLAVVLASLKLGLRPAVFTAAAGVLALDFFFVPPRFSLAVADKEYLVTFLGFFVVGVVISSLVSRTRERAEELREREAETAALYRLSRDIAAAPDSAAVFSAIVRNAEDFFSTSAAILLPDDNRLRIAAAGAGLELSGNDLELAQWSLKSMRRAGPGSASFMDTSVICLPLVALGQCIALLVLSAAGKSISEDSRLDRVIDGFAVQLKMALVRLDLSHQAEQAQILQARENLERALLNSISHDLRSPLSTVTGVLSSLKDEGTHLSDRARGELLETACSEAERLNRFVGNLLDMTRIEAGAIRLNVELCDVQDLVGCALSAIEKRIGGRTVSVTLADELPPIFMDLVLLTQVLVNLLDNAHKYAPPETVIEVTAAVDGDWLVMEVGDQGSGVPEYDLKRVFDKFYRIPVPEGAGGTGLGLSICKGIVEAHGGRISAENRAGGGLRVVVRMPLPAAEEGAKDDN